MRLRKRIEDAETRVAALDGQPIFHGRLFQELRDVETRVAAYDGQPVASHYGRLKGRIKNAEDRLTAAEGTFTGGGGGNF